MNTCQRFLLNSSINKWTSKMLKPVQKTLEKQSISNSIKGSQGGIIGLNTKLAKSSGAAHHNPWGYLFHRTETICMPTRKRICKLISATKEMKNSLANRTSIKMQAQHCPEKHPALSCAKFEVLEMFSPASMLYVLRHYASAQEPQTSFLVYLPCHLRNLFDLSYSYCIFLK